MQGVVDFFSGGMIPPAVINSRVKPEALFKTAGKNI
jgi:hypothetical protein